MSLLSSFFGTDQGTVSKNASALDVTTYLASLASDPKAIDPILDTMREVSSRAEPGKPLAQADQVALAEVCIKLQKYLMEQDPLRTFDTSTLQGKLAQKFPKPSQSDAAFWQRIQGGIK